MRKKLNYSSDPSYCRIYNKLTYLANLNKEGYLYQILKCEAKNVTSMFVAMLITSEMTTSTDILIKGRKFYDNFFNNRHNY